MSDLVLIEAGPHRFTARLETAQAPRTVAFFRGLLPYDATILQARWSGFAAWVPLGADRTIDLPPESPTFLPLPGHLILYPGGLSEPEILFPYGPSTFTSVAGPLAGNHFLTVVEGAGQFEALGRSVQWDGAQPVRFSLAG